MVYYNLSFAETTDLYTLTSGVNTQLDGLLAAMILLSIYIILFISMRNQEIKTVFLADSFIVTIIAVLFWILEFISIQIVMIPFVLLMAAVLIKVFSDG